MDECARAKEIEERRGKCEVVEHVTSFLYEKTQNEKVSDSSDTRVFAF